MAVNRRFPIWRGRGTGLSGKALRGSDLKNLSDLAGLTRFSGSWKEAPYANSPAGGFARVWFHSPETVFLCHRPVVIRT